MSDKDPFDILRDGPAPRPREGARERALEAALRSFDDNISAPTQGSAGYARHRGLTTGFWRRLMQTRLSATPAIAALIALPIAGYAAWQFMGQTRFAIDDALTPATQPTEKAETPQATRQQTPAQEQLAREERGRGSAESLVAVPNSLSTDMSAPAVAPSAGGARLMQGPADGAASMILPAPAPEPYLHLPETRDRLQGFDTNPVRSALENPVSTFSIDVDTASYSFMRRALKAGFLPDAESVRVEEMINYFPYDWPGPETADVPFNSTVTVMPTPWNEHTKLMHVAIKGYDVEPAERPAANLVFLIDTSGSMNAPDRLPLAKTAFRLLVNQLSGSDTVSIVTYAGSAGTVLEPTSVSERRKILDALDRLEPGGSTAGEAGIREAYRLAEQSFVQGGVNRIMLATDGDFNVGPSSDEELKKLVEEKRGSGVFLSVLGFGMGNLNDQLMQTIAQSGNGAAAYIDTLAEAEKVLVEEASSTLFPIAKDVKIQVEFNPEKVAEYRLIGYETRALKREDFNNDRVDAGEIGSGHSVTAIYEITPKGSPAQTIDPLRYGAARTDNPSGVSDADEYAFVKIRYKLPDEDVSRLIETPVTAANELASFEQASVDHRFSVAVAAFGQKLRATDAVADIGYERIMEIATAARGSDPFGYRTEFLSLVRLASALDASR